ncbi:FkbM family methyltransferase [Variovorax sp. W6]|uniref:FkbM family methyltransferase n=1 Tax=Variovorax sp. W6 TaxID=3093895 RepID=UPI003D8030C0
MLSQHTPFRQLARVYAAVLSISNSLAKISQQAATAPSPAPTPAPPPVAIESPVVRQQLDANSRDLASMAVRVERLETLVGHLRTQLASDASRPFLIKSRVQGMNPFPFEIHRSGDAYISTQLEQTGSWEPLETEVVRRLCREGDYVLDIGGNIGWYSVVAAKTIGPSGRIMTFEPDPDNFRILSRNLEMIQGAQTLPRHAAVSDSEGALKLYIDPENRGDHRIFDDGTERPYINVSTSTLDAMLADEPQLPDVVKSDTQGSEARILRGARATFARGWRPVLVMEFWPFGLTGSGDDPMALWNELVGLGYQMFELTEEQPKMHVLTEQRVREGLSSSMSPASQGFINIVAIPQGSDRLASIQDLIAH